MALKEDEERRVGVDDLECQLAGIHNRRGANHHFPQHTAKLRFIVSVISSWLPRSVVTSERFVPSLLHYRMLFASV